MHGQNQLLEYLLEQGASVESEHRPILVVVTICEASDDTKALLIKYGATTDFEETEPRFLPK